MKALFIYCVCLGRFKTILIAKFYSWRRFRQWRDGSVACKHKRISGRRDATTGNTSVFEMLWWRADELDKL